MKRAIAYRFRIKDLSGGEYVAGKTIDNPTYVKLGDMNVSRVDLLGRVLDKSDSGGLSSMTLQDKTGKIKIKVFGNDSTLVKGAVVGDLVRVIGKIRQDSIERFVLGEIVKKIDDANYELLRDKELAKKGGLIEEISF
jgi:RPA family protein